MVMDFKMIMSLPADTDNTVVFQLFFDNPTEEDVKGGTNRDLFAHAHLIEWAVRNKKYVEYYSHIKQFQDVEQYREQERMTDFKEVIVRFNVSGVPLFGFMGDYDGDPMLVYPDKHEMKGVFL